MFGAVFDIKHFSSGGQCEKAESSPWTVGLVRKDVGGVTVRRYPSRELELCTWCVR
jgi:hypothetical protein